ncbi:excinuclease ABC subunit UvrA [Roseimaritima ulvae]|uniref:UvrABC system protein A n=1 Tax=Roseimaritima ulvae TaxID=980254 RepID=A0A5B9QT99_9BACT|nr:excinuclease ABC subunit UvrA [Roseimaritima ulvae]QEG42287.1 UvrABC system protein A [Roseimaritima ulvae]
MTTTEITVRGAREHNLRDVNLKLPRGKLICFSGVSGSGKSSLAFDTLYAEGQRRYVESLSNYARQFMGQMPKPDVEYISGLSPSISVSQKSTGNNPRSTVGTVTEIHDFLRVLYARVGTPHCPSCAEPITAQTRDAILGRVLALPEDATLSLLAPLVRRQKGEFRDLFEDLRKQGFSRARVDGEFIQLAEPPQLDRQHRHDVEVLLERMPPHKRDRGRIGEAVDIALKLGSGNLIAVLSVHSDDPDLPDNDRDILFSSQYACGKCGRSFPPPSPQLFSFNSPQGMCTSCDGLGHLYTFVPELLIPDDSLSLRGGAVTLLGKWADIGRYRRHIYNGAAKWIERTLELEAGDALKLPWRDLPPPAQQLWLWGADEAIDFEWAGGKKATKYQGNFEGLIPELLERYRTTNNKMQLRQLEKFMNTMDCPDCHGHRLNPQALAVRLTTGDESFRDRSLSIAEVSNLSIEELFRFFSNVELDDTSQLIAGEALKEICARIGFLLGVGLDYLTLARTAPTLSGGESQRIRLAAQIGSGLVGVLYILDEPSIGLHPRDNDRLIETLLHLRDTGNTLIVVEHDEDTMRAADLIVDFGPGPGVRGGQVVATGDCAALAAKSNSITGKFLSGEEQIAIPETLRQPDERLLKINGATHNNLKNIDVTIPLGTLCCVTGVSGSGKSSLIGDILEPALRRDLNGAESEPGEHESIEGLEHLDKTIAIDQTPIGRTPRSNPATYVKVFDEIRNLFAQLSESKARGYTASRFSFNVDGGRCSACDGNGANKLEMDFMADIWVTCPVCNGHRYNRETLAVKFKKHSIADVLELDIAQALKLFKNIPKVATKLQTLVDVGLEYLKLGQPSPTLSGGEAQRIKLSRELSKRSTGRTLYVLDEPTTGLHFADIRMLLKVLHGLTDLGNTVLIVEHNQDVIKTADWVIDLGPEGGADGGHLLACGTPAEIAAHPESHTGRALAKVMNIRRKDSKRVAAQRSSAVVRPPDSNTAVDILVEGAEQHNLKSVNARIPRDAMTVFCGPSGSGKSSLAMDTIYAEGQRRYVESLSSYARQFIGQVQKPRVERIEGLSPAVALEQKNLGHSPRSTVGTVTEIYDYFRILMARAGKMYCPGCQKPVGTQTSDQIVDKVLSLPEGTRALLLAPLERAPHQDPREMWGDLKKLGYARVRVDGKTCAIDDAPPLDVRRTHRLQVVIDRIVIRDEERSRIADSVEQGLSLGAGVISVALADDQRDETQWTETRHSQHLACEHCGRSFTPLTPHHFSFNSAVGWCPQCDGLGTQTGTNPAALLSDSRATLADGAALLWPNLNHSVARWMLSAFSRQTGVPLNVPIDELSMLHRRSLYHGTGNRWIEVRQSDIDADQAKRDAANADAADSEADMLAEDDSSPVLFRYQFKGFYPALEEAARLSSKLRMRLDQYVDEIDCSACQGTRVREDAAAVRFADFTIGDYVRMPLSRLAETVNRWKLDRREKKIAGELVREIKQRTKFLLDVGLDYLTIGRGAATLSGGEAQRIRLASQLGSGLCGVLYVLDEPTIGLHPRDNDRLLGAMHRLRDLGNTLLVVEHDHDVIAGSDYLCDFGPGAGRHGGQIVAEGAPLAVEPVEHSVTAPYINGTRAIPYPQNRRPVVPRNASKSRDPNWLTIYEASENNLKDVTVSIPLGVFVAVTGPSGSGKSSLIDDILYPSLARLLHRARVKPGRHDRIEGMRNIDKVIRVDQSPLGNSPSSNPATYTGLFDLIRNEFASLPAAQERRFTARQFSFNVPAGRCEACEGSGQRKIEMHFLPDVWVQCEECQGKRYTDDVLAVQYHGHSIADVLNLSCGDALHLFGDQPRIARILQTICDVGLDYVTLGQAAPTLSGGEAQRVKLAAELARPDTGRTLYLLDEPTTGLHFDDIVKLLSVMQRLVEAGNTVLVIEHNLDVIKCADWIIDMGPEAGAEGGRVVVEGSPEQVSQYALEAKKARGRRRAKMPRSYTGEFLHEVLQQTPAETRRDPLEADATPARRTEDTEPEDAEPDEAVAMDHAAFDAAPLAASPWEALGRRWHTLEKGFPQNTKPQWPLELADRTLKLMEEIAGEDSLSFERDLVQVRQSGSRSNWATLETKVPESLKVTLAGPSEAVDPELLAGLKVGQPVAVEKNGETSVTLHLTDVKHVRSRKLKSFLKSHLQNSQ